MKLFNNSPLFFVAGGSGGHILPALLLAKRHKEHDHQVPLIFCATSKKIDSVVVQNASWISRFIYFPHTKIPASFFSLAIFSFIFSCIGLCIKSVITFFVYHPQKIVTTGGFHSLPLCYIARLCGIPIELYELNSTPGRASALIGRWATHVYVTFESCRSFFPARVDYIEYPHRFTLEDRHVPKETVIDETNEKLNSSISFSLQRKTILIIGGSQGSRYLNSLFKGWVEKNHNEHSHIQIIHQVGFDDVNEWRAWYASHALPAYVFSYQESLAPFYVLADVVISRAGAGLLFELEFFQKRTIIIPLKTNATSHQYSNAYEMALRNPNIFSVQEPYCLEFDVGELDSLLHPLLG